MPCHAPGLEKQRNRIEIEIKRIGIFRTLFEQSPIGITISNNDSILYINDMVTKIFGLQKDEITSSGWKNLTNPDDLELDDNLFKLLIFGKSKIIACRKDT